TQHREACERFANDRSAADADIHLLRGAGAETERQLADVRKELQHAFEAQQTGEATRREAQATFEETLAARDREIAQLQGKVATAAQAHEAIERRLKDIQAEADQLSQLRRQLDDTRAESHRLFHLAPIPMFRCTRDGALTEANRAWTTLVRRKPDEQQGSDFAAAVLGSPNDPSWLIDACPSPQAKAAVG